MHDLDPEGTRLPIKIDSASNGEHAPMALSKEERAGNRLAQEYVDRCCRRLGQSRREFLKSACGAAATLLAFNRVWSGLGAGGGLFDIPEAAAYEPEAAEQALSGDEVIIDLQTHCVDPSGDWARGEDGRRWMRNLTQVFGQAGECEYQELDCYSAKQLVKEVFLDSDTDAAVISALWGASGSNPTPMEYAARARDVIREHIGAGRGLVHGGVLPNEPGQIEFMETQAREYRVDAWKLYPQWGPDGTGFFMDDPRFGLPMLEKARDLGVPIVCAHRGLPLPGLVYEYSRPADIVRVARRYPDMSFLCYHSGFEPGVQEGPYDPDNDSGVDRLIRAHIEQGFEPNRGNVYAELGSCWRHYMSKPDQAAHLLGKLLKHFGEDRIVWGTDALWFGSPQDQIQMFRTFRISESFMERFGYPALTPAAKRKIFGLNAAALHSLDVEALAASSPLEPLALLRRRYLQSPNPSFQTYGPKTRSAYRDLLSRQGGFPG